MKSFFVRYYRDFFQELPEIDKTIDAVENLEHILKQMILDKTPPLYLIIDEYDNFANQLITSFQDALYQQLTGESGFFKRFFKRLKEGRKDRSIYNIFITGILPIAIDDLASAFNIATFLTLDPHFEAMAGFTQNEVDELLDDIYQDYELDLSTKENIRLLIRANYNGYHFSTLEEDKLYNSTILAYFLNYFTKHGKIPDYLTDMNLKTDLSWVKRLTASNPENTKELVNQLLIEESIVYNRENLLQKFSMESFFQKEFYPISFFYLGMFTRKTHDLMCLPNLNMKRIFTEYFNDLHKIDVSTKYNEIMSSFRKTPNFPQLFAGYWKEYVGQLPEAIFTQTNENFYRTTFWDLCSTYLSMQYSFLVESSGPSGRSDLEFIGRFDTDRSKVRFLLEFKYFSNAEAKKKKITPKTFLPPKKDLEQLRRYDTQTRQQHPTASLNSYLVYCFGNQGFKIIPLPH